MPFAPRSFGTGRPSLIKPSSAAMQQFRRGSPSVAPVPLRMPARPPVANRMQQYNTPPQMPPDRGGPFVPPPMPREMPTPPGGGGVLKMPETGGGEPVPIFTPPGGGIHYDFPNPDGSYGPPQQQNPKDRVRPGGEYQMPRNTGYGGGATNPDGTPLATTGMGMNEDMLMQPGGGGFSKLDPRYTNPLSGGFVGPRNPDGTPLATTGQRGMPKYDPTGMGGGELSQPGGGGVMVMQPGGQVQAYAKGGRVMAKPVAKKAVKAAAPAKTASRGDGIAQRGRTKGTMR